MNTLSRPPAANSQSTSSYPMPLTVRLIASTNGASIGNTLRTPKMKNGPRSPLFEEAGFEGALGFRPPAAVSTAARPCMESIPHPRGPADPCDDAEFIQPAAPTENPPDPLYPASAPLRCIPETAQKPGDFSSARL